MGMTAQEWINNMGAGYNFGNTLECHIGNDYHQMKEYYNSSIDIVYGENIETILSSFTIGTNSKTSTINLPIMESDEMASLKINFSNPKIKTTVNVLDVTIDALSLTDASGIAIDLSTFIETHSCDALIDSNTSLILDLGKTATEISGGTLIITYSIISFPKSDDDELKEYLCNFVYSSHGTPNLTKYQIYAVYKAGFKSIRFPITWMNHMDLDTYEIDIQWLDFIAQFVDYAIELGMQVVINLHHDDHDSGWLVSDTYITDTIMQTKYKTVWRQIGEYFADRSDKLAFAGYNETRGSDRSWDTKISDNLYGIIKIGKDFYDTIRSISGNETRVLAFPTYAAKFNMMGSFTNSETGETESFHLPLIDDAYCCAEVHIYETNPITIKSQIDSVCSKQIPFFIGEYGIGRDEWNNTNLVRGIQYMVSYARYKNVGTFLWDDYGGMGCLIRTSATSEEKASNPKIWRGDIIEAIPNICKCGTLKLADIKTGKRLDTYITNDVDSIYLDSKTNVIFNVLSDLTYGNCTVDGEFSAGEAGQCNILALSADGYYNTLELSIVDPIHIIENNETLISDISNLMLRNAPSIYIKNWHTDKNVIDVNRYFSHEDKSIGYDRVLEVSSSSYFEINGCITIDCTSIFNKIIRLCPYVIEIDSNGNFVKYHGYDTYEPSVSFVTKSNTRYVVIGFRSNVGYPKLTSLDIADSIIYDNVKMITKVRDMSYDEHPKVTRYIKPQNINNYIKVIMREIPLIGGIEYAIDFVDANAKFEIIQFNERDEILSRDEFNCGDKFTSDIFTTKAKIYIHVNDNSYSELVKKYNEDQLQLSLLYQDYEEIEDIGLIEEKVIVSDAISDNKGKYISCNGKFITYNGKLLKC